MKKTGDNIETKTEAEFTVKIKETKASREFFREMKRLSKKDKDRKQERIHNQKNFREFIKQKMKK